MMRIASIDIGTNTILLLVSEIDEAGIIHPLHHEQRIPRIGRNVDKEGNIGEEAFRKVIDILKEYKIIVEPFRLDKIIVTGTSAIRDAKNNLQFKEHILKETGLNLDIISGDEEALWTFRGGISGFVNVSGISAVIDIGGGSTEIIFGEGKEILSKISLNIGAVRLTERYFRHDPPLSGEIESACKFIQNELSKVNYIRKDVKLFGVAGTVTTLASIYLNSTDKENINGCLINISGIKDVFNDLKVMTVLEIAKIKSIPKGREDVILAGMLILIEFMSKYLVEELTVSVRGLRYGIALREWEKVRNIIER